VFVLGRSAGANAGAARASGVLPTVAWASPAAMGEGAQVAHALEGGVLAAGSLLQWLAGGLGLAGSVAELTAAAALAGESAGAMILPALAGLGAPWWRSDARGVIAGLHGGVSAGNLAWAALEAIAWRVADIVEAMAPACSPACLRVDGGLSNDETLLALQADALGLPLLVGPADSTVLGAALLAGVGAGVFASVEQAAQLLPAGRIVEPGPAAQDREHVRERWREFVQASSTL